MNAQNDPPLYERARTTSRAVIICVLLRSNRHGQGRPRDCIPAGFLSPVDFFLHALDSWTPFCPLLPGMLRTDSATPSPHINADGFILVPVGHYIPRTFLQELLEATGIPFDIDDGDGFTRIIEDKHPEPRLHLNFPVRTPQRRIHVARSDWVDVSGWQSRDSDNTYKKSLGHNMSAERTTKLPYRPGFKNHRG